MEGIDNQEFEKTNKKLMTVSWFELRSTRMRAYFIQSTTNSRIKSPIGWRADTTKKKKRGKTMATIRWKFRLHSYPS
jgi:hypothetical protein